MAIVHVELVSAVRLAGKLVSKWDTSEIPTRFAEGGLLVAFKAREFFVPMGVVKFVEVVASKGGGKKTS